MEQDSHSPSQTDSSDIIDDTDEDKDYVPTSDFDTPTPPHVSSKKRVRDMPSNKGRPTCMTDI